MRLVVTYRGRTDSNLTVGGRDLRRERAFFDAQIRRIGRSAAARGDVGHLVGYLQAQHHLLLAEAIGRQPEFRLPSNFTYRMMQQVEQEAFLRKKRNEKRIFILWAATLILMGGSALAYLVLTYMKNLSGIEETLKNIPEDSSLLQTFPVLLTVFMLLAVLNYRLNTLRYRKFMEKEK